MNYSNYLTINEQFKNSVNIEYDLMDSKKLAQYIPTEDICEVMQYYISSVLNPKFNRSTILEGPYGKGKSYLVLALTQILSLDTNSSEYDSFLKKLQKTNIDLYNDITELKSNGFKLLPVVINGNYSNLKQALNIALKDALEEANLAGLYPDTVFEVCLKVISQCESNKEVSRSIIEKCLSVVGENINTLKNGLKKYSQDSLDKFTKLYNCVVNGLEFNPFANDDVIKNYKDITHKLIKNGYNGLFIIFDEFSKFIDSDDENIMRDLKILQDLAEVVSRSSKEEQMHLCCITHKSLESYYRNKKETVANAFRTVEGRFKEIRFNRSLNQNYEIISFSIQKKEGFSQFYKCEKSKYIGLYEKLSEEGIFKDINQDVLYEGCFPLNPLTTYAVINISEKIAQNERTLFTFISDNDTNSLSTFIKNQNVGLFNVDKIFDYFLHLIEKSDDDEIRKIYYKAVACLSKTGDILAKQIIKVVAIINIIGNDSLLTNKRIISLCLNEKEEKVLEKLNVLKEEKLLKLNAYNDTYEYAGAGSKVIDAKVDSYILKQGKKENISNVLNALFDSNYVLPRKYNTSHKMTRFYRERYITDFELLSMSTFKGLYSANFCDGFVLRVINTQDNDNLKIKEHFEMMKSNELVILKLSNKPIEHKIVEEIFRVKGLETVLNDFKVDDELIKSETHILYRDEKNQLEVYLDALYSDKNTDLISCEEAHNYFELLSKLMESQYYLTPIINNEMLNMERDISSNYIKARNSVVDLYLEHKIKSQEENLSGYTVSSPENTVYISVKEKDTKSKRNVLDEIKKQLNKAEKKKVNANDIVQKLRSKPYGIRLGVMPVLIAMAIDELDDNIILYFENREIDLNAENVNKMTINPSKYYLMMEKGSKEKTAYLNDLLKCCNLSSANSYRDDIKQIVNYLQNWFLSQPQIIRSANIKNNFISIDEKFIEIKNIFSSMNINEHEVIFETLPMIFNDDFSLVIKYVGNLQNVVDEVLNVYSIKLCEEIKKTFNGSSSGSLYNVITDWINLTKANNRLLEDDEKSFISLFEQKNYNDEYLLNEISKNILNVKLTDWDRDKSDLILSFINKLIETIESKKFIDEVIADSIGSDKLEVNEEIEVSPMAQMLLDNIESAFEEFGESVTNEEKVNILQKLINKML